MAGQTDEHRITRRSDGEGVALIVGRARERRMLEDLVATGDTSGAAVLVGEPGMGKTALLGYARQEALERGAAVIHLRGAESEALLPFAAIADLLLPMRDLFGEVPDRQRLALEACLALAPGPVNSGLAACAGALGVLSAAAGRRPLVILVDDFQWVDAQSAQILLFVARRLSGEQISFIGALRQEPDATLGWVELPTVTLAGLSQHECAELAARRGSALSQGALVALVNLTGGNPLAFLEILRQKQERAARDSDLSPASVVEPLDGALHHSFERSWGRLWRELPPPTRKALFVALADHRADGRHLAAALGELGLTLDSLGPAEQRGLLSLTNEVTLRHPLLRSVIRARTPLATRVSCYRALASAAQGYFRTWYLAAAATGPDSALAAALEDVVDEARQREGMAASAKTLFRAAELTEDPAMRAERLLRAAQDSHMAGDSRSTVNWCEEALRYRQDPAFRVDVELLVARALTSVGDPTAARDGLLAVAGGLRYVDPARAALAYAEAIAPTVTHGRVREARRLADQVERIWALLPDGHRAPRPPVMAQMAAVFMLAGESDRAQPYLEAAEQSIGSGSLLTQMQETTLLAQALAWSERLDRASRHVRSVLTLGRRLVAPLGVAFALAVSAEIKWWTGRWAAGYADAVEALEWATGYSHPAMRGFCLSMLARFEAARGDVGGCRDHVGQAVLEAGPHGIDCLRIYHEGELGLAALGVADLVTAIGHLDEAWRIAVNQGLASTNAVPLMGDLAEALARQGRKADCASVIGWLDERAEVTGLSYPRVVAARARGLLSPDVTKAREWFQTSLSALGGNCPMPFERARTELALGEVLRRARRPSDARDPLTRAALRFERLGAEVWAERARAELAAAGVKEQPFTRPSHRHDVSSLSPQEMQVAKAAARGLNNVEIAGRLFISRKTVEAHLSHTYRKLNIRSRTELSRLLLAAGIAD
jgi:DNA-binding CsgD family transcriptional regulator